MHWFTKYFVVFALPPYIHCKTCGKLHTVTNLSWIFRLKTVFYWLVIDTLLRIVTFLICTEYDACSSSGEIFWLPQGYSIGSQDPAAHQHHCWRCRIRTRVLCPRSLLKMTEILENFLFPVLGDTNNGLLWSIVCLFTWKWAHKLHVWPMGHPPLPIYQQHAC